MIDWRARFDPQGRMNWGPNQTEFPSAWWWDTTNWPILELKVHTGEPGSNAFVLIGSIDTAVTPVEFLPANADLSTLDYQGGAVWVHSDGQGGTTNIDLNDALGDLGPDGITALSQALDFNQLTPGQITDLTNAIDFSQLTPAQLTALMSVLVIVSADAGNVLVAGTDLGAYLDEAAIVAAVNAQMAAGNVDVVSTDAGNLIFAGADNLAKFDQAAFNSALMAAGFTPGGMIVVSADANNLLVAGADGGSFLDGAALAAAIASDPAIQSSIAANDDDATVVESANGYEAVITDDDGDATTVYTKAGTDAAIDATIGATIADVFATPSGPNTPLPSDTFVSIGSVIAPLAGSYDVSVNVVTDVNLGLYGAYIFVNNAYVQYIPAGFSQAATGSLLLQGIPAGAVIDVRMYSGIAGNILNFNSTPRISAHRVGA